MKRLRGNQRLYLTFLCFFGGLGLVSVLGQYFLLNIRPPHISLTSLAYVLFLLAIFLTERYRLYYLNVGLFFLAIGYFLFGFLDALLRAEWGYAEILRLISKGFTIVLLAIFVRYPIRVIKLGRRNKL
jgi:hypothetical protein